MLVRFGSTATESIVMFGDVAVQLIKMLGATGVVPGALSAQDIPAALQRLRSELAARSAQESQAGADEDAEKDDDERDAHVALAHRAVPLIDLLERAAAAEAAVMWERI